MRGDVSEKIVRVLWWLLIVYGSGWCVVSLTTAVAQYA